VLREIKKTAYVPKVIYMGGRDKFCINEDLIKKNGKSATKLGRACKNIGKRCPYNKTETCGCSMSTTESLPMDSLDIEEILSLSKKAKVCPFMHN
jgi:hypothetical protein